MFTSRPEHGCVELIYYKNLIIPFRTDKIKESRILVESI